MLQKKTFKKHGFPWPGPAMCLRKAAVKKRSRSELEIFAFVQPRHGCMGCPLRIESLPVVMTASIDPGASQGCRRWSRGKRSTVIFFSWKKISKCHLHWKSQPFFSYCSNETAKASPNQIHLDFGLQKPFKKCSAVLGGRGERLTQNRSEKHTPNKKGMFSLDGPNQLITYIYIYTYILYIHICIFTFHPHLWSLFFHNFYISRPLPSKRIVGSALTAPSRMDLHRLIQCCHGYQAATGLGYQAGKLR